MPGARRLLAAAALALLLPAAGVTEYLLSDAHAGHDPQHGLQQVDLLYLDEPAPGVTPAPDGSPLVLVFCRGCVLPDVDGARVVVSDDRALARRYGLGAPSSPGYALVDGDGDVRYRTYDPELGAHEVEIQVLVDGLLETPGRRTPGRRTAGRP